jgi:lysophospholipase L1-like esterase
MIHILCIGNSHTAGFPLYDPLYGGNQESSYEFWLEKKLNQRFRNVEFVLENFGICGQISFDILQRLKNIEDLVQYQLVLFWGGANDIGMGFDVQDIVQNLEHASLYCNRKGISCFILNIPPMNYDIINESVQQLNEILLKKYTIKTIDVYKSLVKGNRLNSDYGIGDGVHLSITGYQEVANAIFPYIQVFLDSI